MGLHAVGAIEMGEGAPACVNSYASLAPAGASGTGFLSYPDDFPCLGDLWGVSILDFPSAVLDVLEAGVEADHGGGSDGAANASYSLNMTETSVVYPAELSVTLSVQYRINWSWDAVPTRRWTWTFGVSWHEGGAGWVDLLYDSGSHSTVGGGAPARPPSVAGSFQTDIVTMFSPDVSWLADPDPVYGPSMDISDAISLVWIQAGGL